MLIPGRASIPILALAVVLVVLGHDVLMAADPHEPTTAQHHEHDAPVVDCHLPHGARPAPPDSPDPQPVRLPLGTILADADGWELRRVVQDMAPSYPPDSLRALLQVFLN